MRPAPAFLFKTKMRVGLLLLGLFACASAQRRHEHDGAILIADQKNGGRIILLDGSVGANWNRDRSILWSYSIREAKGVPSGDRSYFRGLFPRLNDAKRVMINGKIHIIITGNGGDGVATIDMANGRAIYYANVGGGPHSVALMPDGNMACADSNNNQVLVLNTQRNKRGAVQRIRHGGSHGLEWDGTKKVMWSWGGRRMIELKYNNNRNNPRFSVVKEHMLPDWDGSAGHDLTPWLGTRKLFFTWKGGIGTFDTTTNKFEQWKTPNGVAVRNPKSVSWNDRTKEMIWVRPDSKATGQSYRSHRARSFSTKDRVRSDASFYKARWFLHNSFSYP